MSDLLERLDPLGWPLVLLASLGYLAVASEPSASYAPAVAGVLDLVRPVAVFLALVAAFPTIDLLAGGPGEED